jgi:2-amino-4-hydroxy-6-hydroxymethyldihydropteridine diphosphokinase
MNVVYLLIGGNIGNRQENLRLARNKVDTLCDSILIQSAIYETAAWGNQNQPAFLNQVLKITTGLSAEELLDKLLRIEKELGRVRIEKYGPRIIDIDILFFNNSIIKLNNLVIPHPEMQNRRFALLPLNEIAPNFIHPVLHKPISELLKECPDNLEVNKIN